MKCVLWILFLQAQRALAGSGDPWPMSHTSWPPRQRFSVLGPQRVGGTRVPTLPTVRTKDSKKIKQGCAWTRQKQACAGRSTEQTTAEPLLRQKEQWRSVTRRYHGKRQQNGLQTGGSSLLSAAWPRLRRRGISPGNMHGDLKTRSDPRGNPSESHQRSASVPLSHAQRPTRCPSGTSRTLRPRVWAPGSGRVHPPQDRQACGADLINIPPRSVAAPWVAGRAMRLGARCLGTRGQRVSPPGSKCDRNGGGWKGTRGHIWSLNLEILAQPSDLTEAT